MNSQLESVFEVLEKMISGEFEVPPEMLEFLQDEEIQERLRKLIDSDPSDFFLDNQELKDDEQIKENLEDRLEAVIDIKKKPVIYILNNTFKLSEFALGGEEISPSMKNVLEKAQKENILEKSIKATCKISFLDCNKIDNKLTHCGTGWLIAKNIIVTNSHVASLFAEGDDKNPSFKPGFEVYINFIAEYDAKWAKENPKTANFKVESVLYAHSVKTYFREWRYPDIAFLQVSEKSEDSDILLPDPISLLGNLPEENSDVAIIGYPGKFADNDEKAIRLQESLLTDVKFGMKVLQPGQIKKVLHEEYKKIAHDCTTWGGNSGSVLVDLKTGQPIGLHFSGSYDKKLNYAVPLETIQEVTRKIGLNLPKTGT